MISKINNKNLQREMNFTKLKFSKLKFLTIKSQNNLSSKARNNVYQQ